MATSLILQSPRSIASTLISTPHQTPGPFYPEDWTGDSDNDLVRVKGQATEALGQVLHLSGRVIDQSGQPVVGALVEIWQCDKRGIYHHSADTGPTRQRDIRFQGRGRISTDKLGRYSFRTIRPVAYPGRTPHIHFSVYRAGKNVLTTQMYITGEEMNTRDFILNSIANKEAREQLIVKLLPGDRLEVGSLRGVFDIVTNT